MWHGVLAGGIGGFVLALPIGVFAGAVVIGLDLTELGGRFVTGVGFTGLVAVGTSVLAVDSVVGGTMGAVSHHVLVADERGATPFRIRLSSDSRVQERDRTDTADEIYVESSVVDDDDSTCP